MVFIMILFLLDLGGILGGVGELIGSSEVRLWTEKWIEK